MYGKDAVSSISVKFSQGNKVGGHESSHIPRGSLEIKPASCISPAESVHRIRRPERY